ncbi:MAG: lysine biosynthesis protein LysX [Thermomicrobiaceae bacterium]|nr:lysine biosynthesis protein LysX [Thermomicrobiaceae bacterium]
MSGAAIGMRLSQVREEEKLLLAAFAARGVAPVRLLDRTLALELTAPDRALPQPLDLVLDRCMAHGRGAVALRALEAFGVRAINRAAAAATADDKVATSLALAVAGVPTLRTFVAFDVETALATLERIGYPAVIKPAHGSWGRLLAKVNSPAAARTLLEQKRSLGSYHHAVFYLQEYVRKPGRDIRVFVVGDEVVAASYRTAEHWVTNVARGAVSQPCPLTAEVVDLALAAARAVGVEIAGVDLVETPEGLKVIEVNGGAEFKGLMRTTDVDIAAAVVDYVVGQARGSSPGAAALTGAAGVR